MASYADKTVPITCPNPKCQSEIPIRISELLMRGKIACNRCRGQIVFSSIAISNTRSAISVLERSLNEAKRTKTELERTMAQFDQKKKQLDNAKAKLESAFSLLEDGLKYIPKA